MKKAIVFLLSVFLTLQAGADPLRVLLAGESLLTLDKLEGDTHQLTYNESVLLRLNNDARFFKGVELELGIPQKYFDFAGSLALALYISPSMGTEGADTGDTGIQEVDAERIFIEALPVKLQSIYRIPLRQDSGMRDNPYIRVPDNIVEASSFPLICSLMPVIKGISPDVEQMQFKMTVKPILSDEGAVLVKVQYPNGLENRPFTLYIDDEITEPEKEILIKSGEHNLHIVSDDYRNEKLLFKVERAKIETINLQLHDPTPLLSFNAPDNTKIFIDNVEVQGGHKNVPVQEGSHTVRFDIGDYQISQNMLIERGKTYNVSLDIGIELSEN